MKKETVLLIAAGAAAIYFLSLERERKRKERERGSVTVTNPEVITEREFETRMPSEQELSRPINQIRNIAQTLFPKRTAQQKAAAQARRLQKRQTKRKRQVAGFSDNVLC